MKTIPSLVASSTVGIAAAGLALGKPERSNPTRPSSKKRKAGDIAGVVVHNNPDLASMSRPNTTSTVVTSDTNPSPPRTESIPNPPPTLRQRSSTTRVEIQNHNSNARRLPIFKHEDVSSSPEEGMRRESSSSRRSWLRRLSIIPNSQNNSPRSSIEADSPSLTVSHGSVVPILSSPGTSPAQLPPNKLVKRSPSGRAISGPVSRSGSRSQVPTLRRPATSHQRSVTLQQQFRDDSMIRKEPVMQDPSSKIPTTPASRNGTPESRVSWRLYFEARPTKLTKERAAGRSSEGALPSQTSTSRRIILDDTARPTLLKPAMVAPAMGNAPTYSRASFEIEDDDADDVQETTLPSTESAEVSQKRPRRSLSMHFSSPGSWIPRSGSLRGNKRSDDGRSGGKRYSSAPVPSMPGRNITTAHGTASVRHRPVLDSGLFQTDANPAEPSLNDSFATNFQKRSRNVSSPLPPLSRLSSFNVDLGRLGLSSSSSSAPRRSPSSPAIYTNTTSTSLSSADFVSPASASFIGSAHSKAPRTSEVADRASTLIGSDNDAKGFASGDEDDMDFQSETVFDSLRSGATGSTRSNKAPLDTMFDESPPSLSIHSKNKRLSIHEMLANGGFQEGSDRIVEEDEGMSTPVKGGLSSQGDSLLTPVRINTADPDRVFPSSPPSFCLATKDFGRMSLDDEEDDDEDWTKDDENLDMSSQLSPPSSSLNSWRASPSFRSALADVTHNGPTNGTYIASAERPKSNLFDWSEPSSTEKVDLMGNSPRPKTAHAKHIADGRGGRAIGRKGPGALHIRSQSVPVVPDVAGQRDHTKMIPKFGTWGLGAKGVSEDWDADFEFDADDADNLEEGDSRMETSGMLVPPAIQASQASVVGHVGQIREVCLLVEDLKRLRLLAKEKNLLTGPSASLWKEAEGIIALAVPDEEDATLSPPHSPASIVFEPEISDDGFFGTGPDGEDISTADAPFEVLNRHGRPTGFVYDGNSVRRRSVFSPEDDIFGAGLMNAPPTRDHLRPPVSMARHTSLQNSSEIARSVMETMHQHRSTSDPLLLNLAEQSPNKMPFDTTSLRDLVHRAGVLSRTLAELVRKTDSSSQSPEVSPHRDSSPAFTRVFTDPTASPPKHLLRTHSNNSILSGSIDSSPTRTLGQRMHMMTVV